MDLAKIKEPLSGEEITALASLLKAVDSGDVEALKDLYLLDYEYDPVDIEEFLSDDYFLGKSLAGGNEIYPYWHDVLQEIFDNDEKHEIILTGPIGTGKSTISVLGLAYSIHKLMCLKAPQKTFGLIGGSSIVFLFFSLSVNLMDVGAFHTLMSLLINSPFFRDRGEVLGTKNLVYRPAKGIIMNTGSAFSAGYGAVGLNVFGGVLDEFNEVPVSSDAIREKAKVLRVYSTVSRRMTSRFMQLGFLFGKLFLVSSTKDDDALLTSYIEEAREKSHVLIYNDPIWKIKPHKYHTSTFTVAVGDQYRESLIINDTDIPAYTDDGYKILKVPEDLENAFVDDINEALQDFAGIGAKTGRIAKLFPNIIGLKKCLGSDKKHPFTSKSLSLGMYNNAHLKDFFNFSMLKDIDKLHYLHVDIGITGDALGLVMGHPEGIITTSDGEQQIKIDIDLMIQVHPQHGSEIPIQEVRRFILWLRNKGVSIYKVSADGYQSRDMLQVLQSQGIDTMLLSVDRTDIPYLTLKSAMFDEMVTLYHYDPLWRELRDLLHDKQKQKVDHPKQSADGKKGSKDVADALAGVVYLMRQDFAEGGLVLSIPHVHTPSNVSYISPQQYRRGKMLSPLDQRLLGIGAHNV